MVRIHTYTCFQEKKAPTNLSVCCQYDMHLLLCLLFVSKRTSCAYSADCWCCMFRFGVCVLNLSVTAGVGFILGYSILLCLRLLHYHT